MSTYFVTGATGFIGGRLVRQLVQAGHKVVTLARNPAKAADLSALSNIFPYRLTVLERQFDPVSTDSALI